jgi:hypothetical protein
MQILPQAAVAPGTKISTPERLVGPRDRRPIPVDQRANDVAHWKNALVTPPAWDNVLKNAEHLSSSREQLM